VWAPLFKEDKPVSPNAAANHHQTPPSRLLLPPNAAASRSTNDSLNSSRRLLRLPRVRVHGLIARSARGESVVPSFLSAPPQAAVCHHSSLLHSSRAHLHLHLHRVSQTDASALCDGSYQLFLFFWCCPTKSPPRPRCSADARLAVTSLCATHCINPCNCSTPQSCGNLPLTYYFSEPHPRVIEHLCPRNSSLCRSTLSTHLSSTPSRPGYPAFTPQRPIGKQHTVPGELHPPQLLNAEALCSHSRHGLIYLLQNKHFVESTEGLLAISSHSSECVKLA
jgi:hypothetical protein